MISLNAKHLAVSLLILGLLLASFIYSTIFIISNLTKAFEHAQLQTDRPSFDVASWEKVKPLVNRPQL